jgi:hypothetical protein
MKTPNIIKIDLFSESRKRLLDLFPPKFEKIECTHITLLFKPKERDFLNCGFVEGTQYQIVPTRYTCSDEIETVEVRLYSKNENLIPFCQNKFPHITISHKEGVAPKKSNEILERFADTDIVPKPIILNGVLNFFYWKK